MTGLFIDTNTEITLIFIFCISLPLVLTYLAYRIRLFLCKKGKHYLSVRKYGHYPFSECYVCECGKHNVSSNIVKSPITDNSKSLLADCARAEMLLALRNKISHTSQYIELCISLTPTGTDRNLLCDANLHLLTAKELIGKVK